MDFIVRLLPAAVCVGGMMFCMRMMGGKHRQSSGSDANSDAVGSNDIETLRDEVARLRSQVAEREEHTAS